MHSSRNALGGHPYDFPTFAGGQVVTTANDYAQGMAMAEDGSVICVGVTDGSWDGNANNGENDFAAFRLDGNGEEIWRYQVGYCVWLLVFAALHRQSLMAPFRSLNGELMCFAFVLPVSLTQH